MFCHATWNQHYLSESQNTHANNSCKLHFVYCNHSPRFCFVLQRYCFFFIYANVGVKKRDFCVKIDAKLSKNRII